MPLVLLSLPPAEASDLLEQCGPLATAGRYVAAVVRAHLAARRLARARALDAKILEYAPLVKSIARRMWNYHRRRAIPGSEASGGAGVVDLEEVEAEVQAELVRRARHWQPARGVTLGKYAEQWLLKAARVAIQRTWASARPEAEEEAAQADHSGLRARLAALPRRLRRTAAAVAGESAAAVDPADLEALALALGAAVQLVPLRELARRLGVAQRTLQARAAAGELPRAVRGKDGRWYVVESTSGAWQDS